jgi:hypothetical protein
MANLQLLEENFSRHKSDSKNPSLLWLLNRVATWIRRTNKVALCGEKRYLSGALF